MRGRVERVEGDDGLLFNVYQNGPEEEEEEDIRATPVQLPRLVDSPTKNVSQQVGAIDWDMLEARGQPPPSMAMGAQVRTVSEDVLRRGDDAEVQPYLRQPVYTRPLGGGLQPAFVPAPPRPSARPARDPRIPSMFAPLPTGGGGGGGGGGGAAPPIPPRGTAQMGGRGLAPLVDPAQSVLTFAALLTDALDTNGEALINPATGMFTDRVMGMLIRARREIVNHTGDETVKLEMLIYDNPENDAVRTQFADLVEYRTLMKGQGYAFAANVYARQAACEKTGGSFTRGYRLTENFHRRRFNIEAYNHKLAWFDNMYSTENPLLERYKKLRVEATNKLARLEGNRRRRRRAAAARPPAGREEEDITPIPPEPESLSTAPTVLLPSVSQFTSDEELSEAEAAVLDATSEDDEGEGLLREESTPADAAMPIGFPRTGARSRTREIGRYRDLLVRAREGYYAIERYMPRVLLPGFQG